MHHSTSQLPARFSFFDTLLNIQLLSHSVASTTQVHQHFKQGISHSGMIWPHDETSLGKHALNWCRCSRNTQQPTKQGSKRYYLHWVNRYSYCL